MLSRIYRTDSEIRKQQINTLKVFNDHVKEVQEGSEYQVLFTAGGNSFMLIVYLSADFPNDKPVLKVLPLIVHPWVNAEGEITSAPGLLNYNTAHSDLGRVVQAVIREFVSSPPHLATEHSANTTMTSPTVPIREPDGSMGRISPSYTGNYLNLQNFSPPSQVPGVYQAVAFPELNALTLDELHFLNESSERRDEFLGSLPQMREMNKAMDDFISQVEELANSNLGKEDRLSSLQRDVEARIEQATKFAFENERLNAVYQSLSEKYSPKNIKDLLKRAAEKMNIESERVAEAFLQGKIDVDEFVALYLQSRTLSQARKTKEEKLSQQLHSLARAGF